MAATAHAQTQYFHEFYAFGDSLSDNGRIPRLTGRPVTNGPLYYGGRFSDGPVYPELLPQLIGVPYRVDNDFAVGGAVSGYANKPVPQFTDQIDQFIASGRPVSPRDVFGMWIGYNDFAQPAALTEPDRVVSNLLANITSAINRLGAIGGREFIVFNLPDAQWTPPRVTFNDELVGALAPLSARGLNIHYFDAATLIQRMRDNPTLYGFAPNGQACSLVPSCVTGSYDEQNRYITSDGVHFQGRVNQYIAAYLANQLLAPQAIAAQAELGRTATTVFVDELMNKLMSAREVSQSVAALRESGDVLRGSFSQLAPIALFGSTGAAAGDRSDRSGALGFDYRLGGTTFGALYHPGPGIHLGAAFNYSEITGDLNGAGGRDTLQAYQAALFGSMSRYATFVDGVLALGWGNYQVMRPGVMGDVLQAAPSEFGVAAAVKAGHLFNVGMLQVGPIADLTYNYVRIGSYAETGDTLLTQTVDRQAVQTLTAGAGVELRSQFSLWGAVVTPTLSVTIEHALLDQGRALTTALTAAPVLPITTTVDPPAATFGKATGALTIRFSPTVTASLSATASAARDAHDFAAAADLKYRF